MTAEVPSTVAESIARLRSAGATSSKRTEDRDALLADARHIERGLVDLLKRALDAGQLDADDAATMLPLVRKVIEGNHG
jgi:hypothetical protein